MNSRKTTWVNLIWGVFAKAVLGQSGWSVDLNIPLFASDELFRMLRGMPYLLEFYQGLAK